VDNPLIIVAVVAVAMPLIFSFVIGLLSVVSGWHQMGKVYRTDKAPAGEHLSFCSARIGLVNYNNCLEYGIAEEGLYVRPFFVLRLFHPTLCIPWSEIESEPTTFLWLKLHRLRMAKAGGKKIVVHDKDFERMKRYLEPTDS